MVELKITIDIDAPPERCFDLARGVDAHLDSTGSTDEKVIAGRQSGLLELGEEVTWEAKHFGIRQRLSSRITQFDRPRFFQDRMIRGAFAELEHDHLFEPLPDGSTRMIDILRFRAPLGPLGWIAERLFLARYMSKFLQDRAKVLKQFAESDQWK